MEAAAAEISEAAGGNEVFPVQCEVRDADAVKAAIDATVEKFGLPGLPTICILNEKVSCYLPSLKASILSYIYPTRLFLCVPKFRGKKNKDTVTSVTLKFEDTLQL